MLVTLCEFKQGRVGRVVRVAHVKISRAHIGRHDCETNDFVNARGNAPFDDAAKVSREVLFAHHPLLAERVFSHDQVRLARQGGVGGKVL